MECLQNRVDSFSKSKRVKNPNKPSTTITLKWPHPPTFLATPDTLAEAGFYFDPSAEDPDNVSCFICDKQLGGWEAEDDPFDIHYDKCAQKCSWANIRCGLRYDMDHHGRFVFPDKSRMPTSKAMEKARLETFAVGDGWIHDKVRGHGASSKKLAKAGLIRTPNNPDDDTATCLYCNLSLSGWDKDDDPMEEHRKRKDKSGYPCPFFQPNGDAASSDSGQPSAKPALKASTSKPPSSRSTSKSKQHQDTVMPTKIYDGDSDGPDHASETKTPARKSRSTASGSSRKSTAKTPRVRGASKASLKEVVEIEEEDEDEDEEPPATVKKPKRTTSKSRAKTIAPDRDEEAEEPPAAPKRKGTRSKSVARSVPSEVEDEPPVGPPTTAKKKAKKARSRSKSVAPSEKTEQSDLDTEAPIVEETAKKPSRSKGKAKAPAPPETDQEEEEPVPRKSSRAKNKGAPATVKKASSKSKSKAKVAEPDLEDKDMEQEQETVEEELEPPKPRTTRKPPSTSSKAPKARSKPAQEQDDSEEVSEDEFGPVIEQPHFAPSAVAKGRSSSKPPSAAKKEPLAGTSSLGKGKPPSSRPKATPSPPIQPPSSIDDEDELGGYSSAPSSPPPPPPPAAVVPEANEEEEDMEMTPLVIPKRTAKPPQSINREVQETLRDQSESSDTVKSTDRPKTMAKSVRQSQAGKPAAEKVRASITKVQDTSRMKVVDVLSSDDDFDDAMDALLQPGSPTEVVSEPPVEEEVRVDLQAKTKGKGKKGAAQAKKSLMFTTSSALFEESMQLTAPVRSAAQIRAVSRTPRESNSPEPQDKDVVEGDVSMQEILPVVNEGQDSYGMDRDTKMEDPVPPAVETPRTSPQPASSVPDHVRDVTTPAASKPPPSPQSNDKEVSRPPQVREEERQPQEPAFFPPLSKLPFVPIQELTEAELDMTVEEWIRYQMEVEYDKFRRDGERELQRFRKRAEEARKIIEGL